MHPDPPQEGIAIVGMATRFPGASTVEDFWRNLCEGRTELRAASEEQLLAAGVEPATLSSPDYVRTVASMPHTDEFDREFFAMSPREVLSCDPQTRAILEVTHAALENAGLDIGNLPNPVGMFATAGPPRYAIHHLLNNAAFAEDVRAGVVSNSDRDYAATLTSYKLDLRGPALTVLTACSSSLAALHLACQSLLEEEADLAVVAGADVEFPHGHGYVWEPGGVRSRDGRCRPFDAAATGTVFASGAAAVVLRRATEAERSGDHVYAVVRGTAINNDGHDKVSFAAPSIGRQEAVIAEALSVAGVEPRDVSCVEAHGTATVVGDPIEFAALTAAFGGHHQGEPWCSLGSVKGNIGHLGPVAGLAGLIKTALCLYHRQLVPIADFERPNPRLPLEGSPFRLQTTLSSWEAPHRIAGVSSLGVGGTNVHVIVEQPPQPAPRGDAEGEKVVVWSGHTFEAAAAVQQRLARYFAAAGPQQFSDAVATLQQGRQAHPVRGAWVGSSAHQAAAALGQAQSRLAGQAVAGSARVGFVFPGQGSQYPHMARGLYDTIPAFGRLVDRWLELFSADVDLKRVWRDELDPHVLADTRIAQPLIFSIEMALAELWMNAGVQPAVVCGHSVGEFAAATLAGVFQPQDVAKVIHCRARAMAQAPAGAMLAVQATPAQTEPYLSERVTVAVVNAADQVVLAGPVADIQATAARLKHAAVACSMLPTSGAFHTSAMASAAHAVQECVSTLALQPAQIPLVSSSTGAVIDDAEVTDPAYWAEQVTRPVVFETALTTLLATEPDVILEVGPGQSLTRLAQRHRHRPKTTACVASQPFHQEHYRELLTASAVLWTRGVALRWAEVGQPELTHRAALPEYPYQRRRWWVEPDLTAAPLGGPDASIHTTSPSSPLTCLQWQPADAEPTPDRPVAESGDTAVQEVAVVTFASESCVPTVARALSGSGGCEVLSLPSSGADAPDGLSQAVADFFAPTCGGQARRRATHILVDFRHAPTDLAASSVFAVLQAVVAHGLGGLDDGRLPQLTCLTQQACDISGAEAVRPVMGAVSGIVTSLRLEIPDLPARCVDVSADTAVDDLVSVIEHRGPEHMWALRGRRRWHRVEVPLAVPDSPHLDPAGVYVVTGGTGGVGRHLVSELAHRVPAASLVLLARNQPADGDWLDTAREHMARHGGTLTLAACDVSDACALAQCMTEIQQSRGAVTGVFHLAGISGGAVLANRNLADARRVFAGKVDGASHLLDWLTVHAAGAWVVLMSSRASIDGQAGGADYAAANAVVDLMALEAAQTRGLRVVSIGFPGWAGTGMAATSVESVRRVSSATANLEPAWATDLLLRSACLTAYGHVAVRPMGQQSGLPVTDHPPTAQQRTAVAPASSPVGHQEMAPTVAGVWCDTLGVEAEDHRDFFDVGGDSLLMLRLLAQVRERFALAVDPEDFMADPTLSGLESLITQARAEAPAGSEGHP